MMSNKYIEFNMVNFPIIFPFFYYLILVNFPNHTDYLIFFTLLILAEPHFGATWTVLINKVNKKYINENFLIFYIGSVLIIIFCLIGFFYFKDFFLFCFFAANIFHVTRQSSGIYKLYNKNRSNNNFFINSIYFFGLLFFLIGLLRFVFYIIPSKDLFLLNLIIILSLTIFFVIGLLLNKSLKQNLTFLTGLIVFYPICFVNSPVHGIILGVTMHYTQYLYLTMKIYFKRKEEKNKNLTHDKNKFFLIKKYLIIISIYGLIMSIFSVSGKFDDYSLKQMIIIPIIGQMLHFYLDSFIWKFSVAHNRNEILRHIT